MRPGLGTADFISSSRFALVFLGFLQASGWCLAASAQPALLPSTQPTVIGAGSELAVALPTTAPTSQPTSDVMSRGLSQLSSGHPREAQAIFAKGLAAYGQTAGAVMSDDQINLLHGVAVSSMRLGDMIKARGAMSKLRQAAKTNRSIQINDAVLDVLSRDDLQRGATTLQKILSDGGPPQEMVVNIFGFAINKMQNDSLMRARANELWPAYHQFESQLTPPSPGMQRWGSKWISADQSQTMRVQQATSEQARISLDKEMTAKLAELDKARVAAAGAHARYDAARQHNWYEYNTPYYASEVASADADFNRISNEIARIKSQMFQIPSGPKPTYDPPPKGVDPTTDLAMR